MGNDKDLSSCEIAWISVGSIVAFVAFVTIVLIPLIQKFLQRRKLNRWSTTPDNTIILHGLPPAKTIPSASPFIMKVEAYLRLAKLQYTWDRKDFAGPRGTTPWITINGDHVTDSQFIIQRLGKEFGKNFSQYSSKEELAVARVVRTMLEEFFNSALILERFVYNKPEALGKIMNVPAIVYYYLRHKLGNRLYEQGLAKHPQQDVRDMMTKHLIAVSTILGDKKYFGGDEMCEDDCGIFGVLAECLWGCPENSPYTTLMHGECFNLRDYCLRVKEKLWPDWNECLAK